MQTPQDEYQSLPERCFQFPKIDFVDSGFD